jgi:cytochrome c biogenesis protein CcdA
VIVIVSTLVGVYLGISAARKREGNKLDMAQYAAGYGIAFALIGLFLTLIIERLAG